MHYFRHLSFLVRLVKNIGYFWANIQGFSIKIYLPLHQKARFSSFSKPKPIRKYSDRNQNLMCERLESLCNASVKKMVLFRLRPQDKRLKFEKISSKELKGS